MTANEQGLWSGGGFETRPPERLPIQIADIELLTNVQ
jgi:hypothetical protein